MGPWESIKSQPVLTRFSLVGLDFFPAMVKGFSNCRPRLTIRNSFNDSPHELTSIFLFRPLDRRCRNVNAAQPKKSLADRDRNRKRIIFSLFPLALFPLRPERRGTGFALFLFLRDHFRSCGCSFCFRRLLVLPPPPVPGPRTPSDRVVLLSLLLMEVEFHGRESRRRY